MHGIYVGDTFLSMHVIAIIVAVLIASSKGRSILGWGILAFFFSWIAVLVVALLPRNYYRW